MNRLEMPNIRKILVPDPGYILIDVDLKGADARVVAWEADDEPLKTAFREGIDIHARNAEEIWPTGRPLADYRTDEALYKSAMSPRQKAKVGVHAVNYGCKARTLGEHLQISTGVAQTFIDRWFYLHPAIEKWHRRIERQLWNERKVVDAFDFCRRYFDRVEGLLPEALAWIGQSTTAIAIDILMVRLAREVPEAELLLQTHDSVTFQVLHMDFARLWPRIRAACVVTVPYPDPLEMPVEFAISEKSWGDIKEFN